MKTRPRKGSVNLHQENIYGDNINMSEVLTKKLIASGKWLLLEEISYRDIHGLERKWESVSRIRKMGAVAIIAIMKPSERLILVRQFRPPAGKHVIEFPAGLIDEKETPEMAAARELFEETGYSGKITGVTPPLFSSPGLSGENVHLVNMEIDETDLKNRNPETDFDDGEHIETFLIPLKELRDFLMTANSKGDRLDAKLISFAEGLQCHPAG
jgi:8-oxo-dGTP pyrophosphatase MutT (NUDIX family)